MGRGLNPVRTKLRKKPNADIKSFQQRTSLYALLYCENDERKDVGAMGLEAKPNRRYWIRLSYDTGAAVTACPGARIGG